MDSCDFNKNKNRSRNFYEYKKVIEIIDGDTFKIEDGLKVRLIGVDTPEMNSEIYKESLYANVAKEYLEKNIENSYVKLIRDISDKDKYGRLLRYVYLEDGTFLNEIVVRKGLAESKKYEPDIRFFEIFSNAEKLAKKEKIGIWKK